MKKASTRLPALYDQVISLISKNELTKFATAAIILLPFYFILYRVYIPHTNAFGCFDECMNYGGAYFMLMGKKLYSEIFFNHQPMMTYLSYIVQLGTHPQNLYEFLLRHMQAILLFSFVWNLFLIRRFGIPAIGFVLFYELSKFYIFGYRFLAESFIVYPLVYMAGLVWYKLQKQRLYDLEYIFLGICTWFVLFSREPYTFVVLFAYLFLIGIPRTLPKMISIGALVVLSLVVVAQLPLSDYIFSVGQVSYQAVLQNEAKQYGFVGLGILKVFLYPFFTLFGGKWNEFRILLTGISLVCIFLWYHFGVVKKQYTAIGILISLLGLANIRVVDPGVTHYEAFHMIPWFGMAIMLLFLMFRDFGVGNKKGKKILGGLLSVIFIVYAVYPNNFLRTNTDRHEQLITNYGQTILIGEVVKSLSDPEHTFFIDYTDSLNLSYWQSQRISPYQYSWYVYVAPAFAEYRNARRIMLAKNPPDFYYGELPSAIKNAKLPDSITNSYYQLSSMGEPSKLYVKKTVFDTASKEKIENAKKWGFEKFDSNISELK